MIKPMIGTIFIQLEINKKEFLMNMARTKEWEMQQGVRHLRQSNETILGPLQDAVNPIEVNAYYAHVKNAICKY